MHPHPSATTGQRGISLIELLIVCAVLAIVLASAAPSFRQLTAQQSLISASNSLVTGLQLARNTAVSSGRPAVLCPAFESPVCADNSAWSHGWLVHGGRNGSPIRAQAQGQLPGSVTVSLGQGRRQVRFLPDGRSPGTNITLNLCSDGIAARQIIVSNSGRVRTTPVTTTPC